MVDFEEIRRAYRARIKAVHPDLAPGREHEAKQLTTAYATLSDPDRRSAYDRASEPPELDERDWFVRVRRVVVVWEI